MRRNTTPTAAGWKEFSRYIRDVRAGGRCECEGECGLHRVHPGPRRCVEVNGQPARFMKPGTRVILTVAHLNARCDVCSCDPLCIETSHVKAMCQRCHLRYDVPRHVGNAHRTRAAKFGQAFLAMEAP